MFFEIGISRIAASTTMKGQTPIKTSGLNLHFQWEDVHDFAVFLQFIFTPALHRFTDFYDFIFFFNCCIYLSHITFVCVYIYKLITFVFRRCGTLSEIKRFEKIDLRGICLLVSFAILLLCFSLIHKGP